MSQSLETPRMSDPTQAIRLAGMVHGVVHTQLLFVAAKLGLADLLSEGGLSIEELARRTGTRPARLHRVMRALASLGVFVEDQPRHFALTPLAEPLREDHPSSLKAFAVMMGSEWHLRGWGSILHAVRNDESSFRHVFGTELFEYLNRHPEDAAEFNSAMAFTSGRLADAICRAYTFEGMELIADVGGGEGVLLSAVLKSHPRLKGLLVDLPSVAAAARARMQSEGLADRCAVVEGDFFAGLPSGADLYLLKYIIHDWDDADAVRILKTCREAMPPHGKLLVVDAVMPDGAATFRKTWADIEMMVLLPNGRERTEAEFQALFSAAGLRLTRTIPTRAEVSLLEGVPADRNPPS